MTSDTNPRQPAGGLSYGAAVPVHYLNRIEVAERIGVKYDTLNRYKLPEPDVIVGPVNDDGTLPRGTVRGWSARTIDAWNAARPSRRASERPTACG